MANTTNSPSLEGKSTATDMGRESNITKILVAGSGAVGKTTLVKVLRDDAPLDGSSISQEYHRTPFIELETVKVNSIGGTGSQGLFLMVDVAGQLDLPIHALRDFSKLALGSVEMVLLVFSADDLQSLLDLQNWIELIKTQYVKVPGKNLQFVLIMNKCDLERNIDPSLVSAFMDSEPLISGYFELSCMNGEGLEAVQACLLHLANLK
jgi:small GTP-binding protein